MYYIHPLDRKANGGITIKTLKHSFSIVKNIYLRTSKNYASICITLCCFKSNSEPTQNSTKNYLLIFHNNLRHHHSCLSETDDFSNNIHHNALRRLLKGFFDVDAV